MAVTIDHVPTPAPAVRHETSRRRRRRWYVVVPVALLAVVGTALTVGASRGTATPAPPGLTWYWNPTFAQGGTSLNPPGWNILWGQGAPTQTFPSTDRCALEVAGQPELINVPCNAGFWHWSGTAGGPPAAHFLVVSGDRATLFPVG
jgi:hypothetical protein